MVDPGDDFGGYMEQLAATEDAAARAARILEEHEFWRQTTWGGWVVRQIQTTGRHFKPFVAKVSVMMQDEGNLGKRLLMFFLRLLIIAVGVLFVLAMGRVFTFLVGGDIIKEEEVVVVHEYDTIEEAMKARAATGRGKKSRQHTKDE